MSLRIVPPLAAAVSAGGSVLAAPSLHVGLSGELAPTAAAPAAPPAAAAPAPPAPDKGDGGTVARPEPPDKSRAAQRRKPVVVNPYHYHAAAPAPHAEQLGELRAAAPISSPQPTDYGERLVKLIPSEVVGIYLVGVGIIPSNAKTPVIVWAIVCFGLVVLARAYGTRAPNLPPQWKAVFISCVSFVIWVYTIPGPFQSFGLAVPYVGSLAILVWTFVVPYFYTGA